MGVSYVDLYLIHNPYFVKDLAQDWKEFEKIKEAGLAKSVNSASHCCQFSHKLTSYRSIGVSNFGVPELTELLASAKVKPAANQVSSLYSDT